MNKERETDIMQMGVDLGIFTLASIIAEGYILTPTGGEVLKQWALQNLEEKSGKPAEDIESMVVESKGILRDMLNNTEL